MKKTTPKTQLVSIPPLAAALARLLDAGADRVPEEFLKAYAAMPNLFEEIQRGDDDQHWTLVNALSGLKAAETLAERRIATHGRIGENDDLFDEAVECLMRRNVDLVASLVTLIMSAGMHIGLAFACYALLEKGGAR